MKLSHVLSAVSILFATQGAARPLSTQHVLVDLGIDDLGIDMSVTPDPRCLDRCLDVFSSCRMPPDGCKMLFVRCLRDCEAEPAVEVTPVAETSINAPDPDCMEACKAVLNGCGSPSWWCRIEWAMCVEGCRERHLVGIAPENPEMSMEAALAFDFTVADCQETCIQNYVTCKLIPLVCRQKLVDCLRACDTDLVGTAPQNPEISMEAALPFDLTVADCQETCVQSYVACRMSPVACRKRLIDCLKACEKDLVGTASQNPEMSMEAAFPFDRDSTLVADSCPDICFQRYRTCKMSPLACRQNFIDCLRACESDLVGTPPPPPPPPPSTTDNPCFRECEERFMMCRLSPPMCRQEFLVCLRKCTKDDT